MRPRAALVLGPVLVLVTLLTACGDGSSPEATVRQYFRSLEAGDSERLAATFLPELGESLRDATLPEISFENLSIERISKAQDTVEVAAEFDTDFPTDAHLKVRIVLVKRDGEWLISSFEAAPPDA